MTYSVEIAHIYLDQDGLREEQLNSILNYKSFVNEKKLREGEVRLCVWVDDYNPKNHLLDIKLYKQQIKNDINRKFFLCSETMVANSYSIFRNLLDERYRSYYDLYLKKKKHLPCSLVTAMWYFLRLKNDFFGLVSLDDTIQPSDFKSDLVINFLPKKFANSEKKVKDIIRKNSQLKIFSDKVITYFY